MAATRALSVILAAAAAAAAAETCPNLWTQANVAQSKTIQDIGADGSLRPAFWKASELQGLFALLETGERYTMSSFPRAGPSLGISSPCSVLF